MGPDQIVIVLLGALAGGFVNGLTGFGTGITAIGLWLYAVSPPVAASLVVICSVVSGLQTLPRIWGRIEWRRVLPFVIPGLIGVPLGTRMLAGIDAQTFKIGIGLFLCAYSTYALARKPNLEGSWGHPADYAIGFGGGILGGLAGLSGILPVVWADIRGYGKDQRRVVLQVFNLSILTLALAVHAASGLLEHEVQLATLAALPGTIFGAWAGSRIYQRLGDHGFQRVVMLLLLVSGLALISTSA